MPEKLNIQNIESKITSYIADVNNLSSSISADSTFEFLTKIKREPVLVGPYPHVTLFEAANRIMTDLTILYGIKELLEGKIEAFSYKEYTVELGHFDEGDNDIFAEGKNGSLIGEAFNVAPSFFQGKKAKSLRKMYQQRKADQQILLIYNADAVKPNYTPKPVVGEFHLKVDLKRYIKG